jgi:type II secretion system protein L
MQTRLVLLSNASERPSPWLIVEGTGLVVARGVLTPVAPPVAFKGRTILIVPGTGVLTRWLDLEDGPPEEVVETVSALLKDEISAPKGGVHIALGEVGDDGLRPVCIIDRFLLQEYLDRAADLDISPHAAVPDHLMLPSRDDDPVAVELDGVVAVRGSRIAFTVEEELASMLIGGHRAPSVVHGPEIERLFAAGSAHVAVNLLQQEFGPGRRAQTWGAYRRLAGLAALAALSPLGICAAEIARNEVSAREFEQRAEGRARSIVNDTGAADPSRELRARVAGSSANDTFLRSAAALFEAMSSIVDVELESLSYMQDGVTRASLIHAATADVNRLRRALEQSGVVVDQDAPEERDGRMLTTITLKRPS